MAIQKKRLAVFASGRGSNLKRVFESISTGELQGVELAVVISNRSTSEAIEFAKSVGVEARHHSLKLFDGDELRCDQSLLSLLEGLGIDFIALLGYLKKLPDSVVSKFENRILNVHPALLPAFGGLNMYGQLVHQAVLARGCKVSGASVHFVSANYDEGPIVLQECCPVRDDDTAESLASRVLEIEHRIIPKAIQLLADGRLRVGNNKVFILA